MSFETTLILFWVCLGKPGKACPDLSGVRTGFCFLEREMALRKWRKAEPVVFSGLLFFGYFLFGGAKESNIN